MSKTQKLHRKMKSGTHAHHPAFNFAVSVQLSVQFRPFFSFFLFLLFPLADKFEWRKLRLWSTHVLTQRQRNVNCRTRHRTRVASSSVHRFPNWRTKRRKDGRRLFGSSEAVRSGKSRMGKRGERESLRERKVCQLHVSGWGVVSCGLWTTALFPSIPLLIN